MSRLQRVLLAVALTAAGAFGAGCSGDDDSLANCADVYREGENVSQDLAENGCRLPGGDSLVGVTCERVDGDLLVTFERGEPPMWGIVGEPLRVPAEQDFGQDLEYQAAKDRC